MDIKLDNILLDENFNPKICDFGYAQNYSPKLNEKRGTIFYIAPEVVEKEEFDGYKVDIFGLGMAMISLATGKYKFYKANGKNKFYRFIKNGEKEKFWNSFGETINKSLSTDFKDLAFKMISYEPEKRPKNIKEILKDKWFENIPKTAKELEKHENDIKLKETLLDKKNRILFALIREKVMNIEIDYRKANTRGKEDEKEEYFKLDAKCEFINDINFTNFYINITGELNPVNFMNSLYEKIIKQFGEDNCNLEAAKNELKFDINFEDEEDESSMQIILYKTAKGYVLRFLRKKMDRKDFFDKFEIISGLV